MRRRKTADEINLLEKCFEEDEDFHQETVDYLLKNTHLTKVQIYKWGWDQKKKSLKNPQGKRIPSIDEFGGYCKFDQKQDSAKLTKVVDIDWNEQIRLLDLDWAREEKSAPTKIEPIQKDDHQFLNPSKREYCAIKAPNSSSGKKSDDKSFSTPAKKLSKRDRYCSDLTNVSNSAKNLLGIGGVTPSKSSSFVNPLFEEDLDRDYSFENIRYVNFEYLGSSNFMYPSEKVSTLLFSLKI